MGAEVYRRIKEETVPRDCKNEIGKAPIRRTRKSDLRGSKLLYFP